MSKAPVIPVHVLVDEGRLCSYVLTRLANGLAKPDAPRGNVRLSVLQVGRIWNGPEIGLFTEGYANVSIGGRSTLSQAFERVAEDYQRLDAEGEGMSAGELLLFLTVPPADDWRSGWEQLQRYRAVILSYWVVESAASELRPELVRKIVELLSEMCPTDLGEPRYKIAHVDADVARFVDGAISKLEDRLGRRLTQVADLGRLRRS